MLKKLVLVALVALGLRAPATSQGFYTDTAAGTTPINGQEVLIPIANGQVRVCSLPLTQQQPCLPLAVITDLNGNILNVSGGGFGQVTTDGVGRFNFGCSSGSNLQIQVAASSSDAPQLNYAATCPGSVLPPGAVIGSDGNRYGSLQACHDGMPPATGGVCTVTPGYSETLAANLVISKSNITFLFQGAATINQGSFQVIANQGAVALTFVGESVYGGNGGTTQATRFIYTGNADAWKFGTSGSTTNVNSPRIENIQIDATGAGSGATALDFFCVGHWSIRNAALVLAAGAITQRGLVTNDGSPGCFSGGGVASNLLIQNGQIAIQLNGSTVESTFIGTIATASSAAGSIGIDYEGIARSNVFHGGTVSGYMTAIHHGDGSAFNVTEIETDSATTNVSFGSGTYNNEVMELQSTTDVPPVVSYSGTNNLVRLPGGVIAPGGSSLVK